MKTELTLLSLGEKYYPTVDGVFSADFRPGQTQWTLLVVTPRYEPYVGFFDFEHLVWTVDGQGYRAHAKVSLDSLWELTFGNTPVYSDAPREYMMSQLISGENLLTLSEKVRVDEEDGRRCHRAWALQFASDYIYNGDYVALKGDILPVLFRQKKFAYACKLYANGRPFSCPTYRIFAVFEKILGAVDIPGGGSFEGPIIAHEYLSHFLEGKFRYYERCNRAAPSGEFRVMRLMEKPRSQ